MGHVGLNFNSKKVLKAIFTNVSVFYQGDKLVVKLDYFKYTLHEPLIVLTLLLRCDVSTLSLFNKLL